VNIESLPPLVVAAVEDIFFSTRIETVARRSGVRLELALDAQQLHQFLAQEVPDLIVMDLNSRTCAPIDSVRRIKADPRLAGIRIIGFFSHVQVELERAARAAGCDQVIARSAFTAKLQDIITGSRKR
jgi:CheY-like chemotaxis protein